MSLPTETLPLSPSTVPSIAGPTPAPRWFKWLLAVALAGYAVFLSVHMTTVAGGADSSGYMNSARLFAAGELRTPLRVPSEFSQLSLTRVHFEPAGLGSFPPSSDIAPTYPTGFPLHIALSARLLGWKVGPFAMQLALALAAVWLTYLAGRELGLHYALAATGAVALAGFPVFIFTSFQSLSDTAATTWSIATVYFALRAQRGSIGWSIACGTALAIAVLVRPTNVLLAPALIVLLGFNLQRWIAFVVGGVPGAAFLLLYNHHVYGGALRSGYGNIFAAFGSHYFVPTVKHFGKWLALFLPPILLALPLAALAHRDTRTRSLYALLLLAVTNIIFYCFCSFSADSWPFLRYILPGLPALILAGLLGVEALARSWGRRWPRVFRPIAATVLTAWAVGNSWHYTRSLTVLYVPGYELAYEQAAQLVRRHVPENALVVCCNFSGTIYYYTANPALLFDSVSPEAWGVYSKLCRDAGRPIYAALFDIEEDDAFKRHCPGDWKRVDRAANISIWKLE